MPANNVRPYAAVRVVNNAGAYFLDTGPGGGAVVNAVPPAGVNSGAFASVTRISIGRIQVNAESNETFDPTNTYCLAQGESLPTGALGGAGGVVTQIEPRAQTVAGIAASNPVSTQVSTLPLGGVGTASANGIGGFVVVDLYSLSGSSYGRQVDGTFYLQLGLARG